MLSENVQALLVLVRNVFWLGIIGYGFWFLVIIMAESKIQEQIVPVIMKMEERIKNLGGEKKK